MRAFLAFLFGLVALSAVAAAQFFTILSAPLPYSAWNSTVDTTYWAYSKTNIANDTATHNSTGAGSYENTWGTQFRAAGRWYFEVKMGVVPDGPGLWVSGATTALGDNCAQASSGTGGFWYQNNGDWYIDGSSAFTGLNTFAASNYIAFAVDFTAGKVWVKNLADSYWDNVSTDSPVVGSQSGGLNISSITTNALTPCLTASQNTEAATLNTGGTAFNGSIPSGFTAWH